MPVCLYLSMDGWLTSSDVLCCPGGWACVCVYTGAGGSSRGAGRRRVAFEGLRTVVRHPYVMALAGISCLYEMVLTILDYEMKVGG